MRYYFIKDRVETGDVVIEHCPTEKMLGDHINPSILPQHTLVWSKYQVKCIYDDMRGHTGGTMSTGKDGRGSIISISKKQKLNTKISTEAELIGADNAMPQMLWTRYFQESQGYGIDENILYQENMSVMLLENNGKKSSAKKTKHINMRYYFIKDRVETGDVVIEHLPTRKILGDHFTKPLQGALFRNSGQKS